MNRTITMNLSGIIFHIEEGAYEKLNKYLATIKGYFASSEGRDEIMNDIEARIAEMLQEKVSTSKQAVLMADVDSVIEVMGKPEDFAGDTANAGNSKNTTGEKFTSTKRRRVFRDPDDKTLGGVCSGISKYFDFDPIWLRGAFVVGVLFFGSGLLLYIILWIIIPLAKTTAEKLEMQGEKVDVNNIGKAVNEEFDDLKKRMKDLGDEVGSKENRERFRTSTQKAVDFTGNVFYNFFKVVGKVIATILVIIAVFLMIILLGLLFGSMNMVHIHNIGNDVSFSLYDLTGKFFPPDMSIEFLIIGLLLVIGIPLLSIIYYGIKLLFGIKHKNKMVKYTLNILWWVGLGFLIYIATLTIKDFSEETTVKHNIELKQKDTLFLSVKNVEKYIDKDYHRRSNFRIGNLKWSYLENYDEDNLSIHYPVTFDIVESETDSLRLILIKSARGQNKKEAQFRAKNIQYSLSQTDSLIEFEPSFGLDQTDKWRGQEVRIILKVPQNNVIYLNRGMEHIIFDIDNVNDALDSDMINRRWIMTKQGLQCIDCENLKTIYQPEGIPVHPPPPPAISHHHKKEIYRHVVTIN
ncbi:MAG: PspC domain-containing protein [Bacteroidota bacterium]